MLPGVSRASSRQAKSARLTSSYVAGGGSTPPGSGLSDVPGEASSRTLPNWTSG